jgi:hypothetical protein
MIHLRIRSHSPISKPPALFNAILFAMAFFASEASFAQCNTTPCQTPTPQVNPMDACILPNPAALDCYYGAVTNEPPVAFPPWCGVINNNHWFAFTADAATATFDISVFDCAMGNGLQAAIFSTSDCENFTITSNCLGNIPTQTTQTLVATDLTPGQVYYLCIDGSGGALCGYTINGVSPTVNGPTSNICIPSAINAVYTTAETSVWHISPPTAGNIMGSNTATSVVVEWVEPGAAQVCAQSTVCPDAPEYCVDVMIGEPVQTEEFAVICYAETYSFFGLSLSISGDYDGVVTGSNGCDSTITLHLTVLPLIETNLNAGICTGSMYVFQGDTLTESGSYLSVLPAANGCDSLIRLKLAVVDSFDIHLSAVICDGESFAFGDSIIEQAGVYVDSLFAIGGCDSVVTLTLAILPALGSQINVSICDGSSYIFHGDTLKSSGVYLYPETGASGCDSIVTFVLETVPFYETALEATICAGETYTLGTTELTTTGMYTDTLSAVGGCDSILTLNLTVLPTFVSTASATICAGDIYLYQGDTLTNAGIYEYPLEAANGCDSVVTFNLTVLESPNTFLTAVVCNGESFFFYGELLSESGVYDQIFEAVNGCDSTESLILTVLPELTTALQVPVCIGETYDFNGDTLSESGVYTQVLVSEFGCDSTVTITLTVLPAQSSSSDAVVCFGETYEFDGAVLAESGTYTAVLSDVNGCDSTVTLHLEVLPVIETSLDVTLCDGSSYTFGDTILTTEGVYTAVLPGIYGCDSTVTLHLIVLPTQSTSVDATICAGTEYNFFGQVFTEAGTYEFVLAGENGCDSTVTVHLTVLPLQFGALDVEICSGESYSYNGDTLTETGVYSFAFLGANGCDSIFFVYLTVHPAFTTILNETVCEGQPYVFNGITLVVSGSYIAEYTSIYGCDSTINLNLTFVTAFETALEATVCAGETYLFGTDTLAQSGDYHQTFSSVNGCDSVVTLTLTVLPTFQSTLNVGICFGETYTFEGAALSVPGAYTAILSATNGCDSTVVLNLSILPSSSSTIAATICQHETFLFSGAVLDETGVYTANYAGVNGCDSIVTLTLTVLPAVTSMATATICAGEIYNFNGDTLSETGSFTTIYTAASGCDSVVILALTVTPLPQSAFASVVCGGVPFEFNGEVLTESGVYSFLLAGAAVNGCDSMITLFLTIFPAIPPTTVNATICPGESYPINGQLLNVSGQYTFTLSSSTGCDSVVILNLMVLPAEATAISAVVCAGGVFVYQGVAIPAGAVQTFLFSSSNGCDSVVTVTVTAEEILVTVALSSGVLTATSSPNATFQWINCDGNQPISGATGSSFTPTVTSQYAVIITNSNGCTAVSGCVPVIIVSVKEPLSTSDWVLQPNPARSHTAILLKETFTSDIWLEVFDSAGRLLHQEAIASGTNQVDLDISAFPDGILLVRLMSNEGVSAKLLMKGN